MVRLLCVVGYPGSGKSAAADIAAEAWNIPVVVMGNLVRERAERDLDAILSADDRQSAVEATIDSDSPLREQLERTDFSRSSLIGAWATAQRNKYGDTVVAEWTAQSIQEGSDAETVLVDGVRSLAEYEVFEKTFTDVELIHITAPFETRLERLRNRGRDGEGEFTPQDLRERDQREDDWGVSKVIETADVTIENTGSLEDYEMALERVLVT